MTLVEVMLPRPEMSAAAGELGVVRRYRRRANADTARKRWRPS
jgi:hypothetical protein